MAAKSQGERSAIWRSSKKSPEMTKTLPQCTPLSQSLKAKDNSVLTKGGTANRESTSTILRKEILSKLEGYRNSFQIHLEILT